MTRRFTDTYVRGLRPQASRYEVWDGTGLGLRVTTTGRKSWVLVYHFEGHPRRMTIGTYPQIGVAAAHTARDRAKEDLKAGTDPGARKLKKKRVLNEMPTIAEFAEEYMDKWAKPRKKSWKEDQRILQAYVVLEWKRKKLQSITGRDVTLLLDKIEERGAIIMADRVYSLLSRFFNFAIERGILEGSPCDRLGRRRTKVSRDRWLSAEELPVFWNGLELTNMDPMTRLVLRFILATGQRPGEVVGSRWDDIDIQAGLWRIPPERTKNARLHAVPLSAMALSLLGDARRLGITEEYVFPSPKTGLPMVETSVARALRFNLSKMGLSDLRPHDLRRTVATHLGELGYDRTAIGFLMNHSEHSVTAIYDRSPRTRVLAEALEVWGQHLARLTNPPSKIVELKQVG